MLAEMLPRQQDCDNEDFIEQAARRITHAIQQRRWRLGISPRSIGDPEHSVPGCVYHIALVCCKPTYESFFTLGLWPPTLLYDLPPRIPDKPQDPHKAWTDYDTQLGALPVAVRLQEDEETLVRQYLPEIRPYRLLRRETALDYALVGTLDVFTQASLTDHSPITFPGLVLALQTIM